MISDLKELIATNPSEALTQLASLILQNTSAENFELYGYCLLKLNRDVEAIEAYEKALTLNPLLTRIHFSLAQVYQKTTQYEKALYHLEPCLNFSPTEPRFLFQMGACHLQLEHFSEAQKYFQQVLQQEPHHLESLVNLGICFLKSKDFDLAIYYLATACRVDENYAPAHYNLACTLMEAKRLPQAQNQFEQYLEKFPQDLEARYHHGFVLMGLERFAEAQKCFQTVLQANPKHVLAMHNLASIALKENEPSVALGYYQRILVCRPEDEIASYMQAALTQKNAPAQAPKAYVKALFDQYAEYFDQHLKEGLHYQTPQHLYDLWCSSSELHRSAESVLSVLDLGCGTGLAGELFKSHAKKLIGVDLSLEMLKQAEVKNIYDELREADILQFLNQFSETNSFVSAQDNGTIFDLVILADVLVYFGDLNALFAKLSACAKAVLLSIEYTAQPKYELTISGRYRHPLKEVLAVADRYQFTCIANKQVSLRTQNHQAVSGYVIYFVRQ